MSDETAALREAVCDAFGRETPLALTGGGSKGFYGRATTGTPLPAGGHSGIVSYEPSELVLTARAGTPLTEVEAAVGEQGQMLAFEPPQFGTGATLGGTIACGVSGPRRPWAGSARDFVLGMRVVNGRGDVLHFGGEVMKNVAGYDVSRLMAGALGTLGLILEVSLKVLPVPEEEITLVQECDTTDALESMNLMAGHPLPLSAACHDGRLLYLRLSGAAGALRAGRDRVGGEPLADGARFWRDLREHRHPFFPADDTPLWRLSLPSHAPHLALPGRQFIDWGGAQRWLVANADATGIREAAVRAGGHATLFRGGDRSKQVFTPPPGPLFALHRSLKRAFDPKGILNPGRLYREL